ncbi:protein-tyrosine-phosphatase [Acidocella aquatica]|uniref:Protein-tyrosine-phosphatase n=1 Tax=Acidocella aquatica TaxID=1922313 RepID=A0ABQ5ZYR7_9PROT|nr:hypothetical protein [Acidocella aquatica]GLR65361.1 protein-tyrosine-phosphatase [Acidocella aquatica]
MKLIVCPLTQLEQTLASTPSHVLSLISPGTEAPVCPGAAEHLILRFNDINGPAEGLTPAMPADIETLITFARDWQGLAPMLTHCWAGISRSTAAAYIIACLRHPPGHEPFFAKQLRHAAPEATPNPRMVALADTILGREGRMISAIAAIGRGREAGQGVSFSLEI